MEAYKPYLDYITSGGVAETAYILSRQGAICATSLPIQQLPQYNFDLQDDKGKVNKIIVDERVNLLEALQNKGVCVKHPEGIRLYNQKYYPVNFQEGKQGSTLYLKKTQGGACICITKQLILIGTFNVTQKMSNGVPQNPGELNKRVQTLADTLIKQGY